MTIAREGRKSGEESSKGTSKGGPTNERTTWKMAVHLSRWLGSAMGAIICKGDIYIIQAITESRSTTKKAARRFLRVFPKYSANIFFRWRKGKKMYMYEHQKKSIFLAALILGYR